MKKNNTEVFSTTFNYTLINARKSEDTSFIPEIFLQRSASSGSIFENKRILYKDDVKTQPTDLKLFSPLNRQGVSNMIRISKPVKTFVVLSPGEDGYIVAECPSMPGCISQGQTREEAIENIKEAIELCRELRLEMNIPEFEVVELEV